MSSYSVNNDHDVEMNPSLPSTNIANRNDDNNNNLPNPSHEDSSVQDVEMTMDTFSSTSSSSSSSSSSSNSNGQNQNNNRDILPPIARLMDELKHVDVSVRMNAIKQLSSIAEALGPERTRSELMPFLKESILDEEDEILFTLAEELGNPSFIQLVGGAQYTFSLLDPLESLCGAEEPIIRNRTLESLNTILGYLPKDVFETLLIPLTKRLTEASWYTNRMSAAALYSMIYPSIPSRENRLDFLKGFIALTQDETPMVRRAAANHIPVEYIFINYSSLMNVYAIYLKELIQVLERDICMEELYPSFLQILQDEQDSVRLLSVKILIALSEKLSNDSEKEELILPAAKSLFTDKSWRVRYMVANLYTDLLKSMSGYGGPSGTMISPTDREALVAFTQLLRDPEAEVRTAATSQISVLLPLIRSEDVQTSILPALEELAVDSSPYVRSALALHVSDMAGSLGQEHSMEKLMPLLMQLLKDEHSDVRLNVISKLEKVNEVVGINILSQSLLPAIVELAGDKQWRVRLAIIEHTPLLASQLGQPFFNTSLIGLTLSLLEDPVYAVRQAAISALKQLAKLFGSNWTKEFIFPKILECSHAKHYLNRITALFAISELAELIDKATFEKILLPLMVELSSDAVPNVRFNVAKTISAILSSYSRTEKGTNLINIQSLLRPVLDKLSTDPDRDVQYFTQLAQKIISEGQK